jgi:hypothetical protein
LLSNSAGVSLICIRGYPFAVDFTDGGCLGDG